jgi:hypothetical protein
VRSPRGLAAGQSRTVKFTLKGIAAKLLVKRHTLKAKLTVTSTPDGKATSVTRVVTFKVPRKHR